MTSRISDSAWLPRWTFFNLNDVIIPEEKVKLVKAAQAEVDEVMGQLQYGSDHQQRTIQPDRSISGAVPTARLTFTLMNQIKNDKQGFNSVYMMLDSGARGSKEQIKQLAVCVD
jgi:DNA-directed RNA polymerase subunit beta'